MTEWIVNNSGSFIIAGLGGLCSLILLLMRLSWNASRLAISVDHCTDTIKGVIARSDQHAEQNRKEHEELFRRTNENCKDIALLNNRTTALEVAGRTSWVKDGGP